MMSVPVPIMSHDQNSCCTSFQTSWPNECNCPFDNTIITWWCWCQFQWCHMTKMSCCPEFQSSYLDLTNVVVPLMMPLVSCEKVSHDQNSHLAPYFDHLVANECKCVIDNTIGIRWCWCQCYWCHLNKTYLTLQCDHLNLVDTVLTLVMQLPIHDAHESCVTWPKSHVAHHFDCLEVTNAMVSLIML